MNYKYIIPALVIVSLMLNSCQDDMVDTAGAVKYPDNGNGVTLKGMGAKAGIKMGVSVTAEGLRDEKQAQIVATEFDNITFGNELKHSSVVLDDGTMNFSAADEMMEWAKRVNVAVFGHTLVWHSQQCVGYLNSLVGDKGNAEVSVNLITNSDFETDASGYSIFNADDKSQSLYCTDLQYVYAGNGCLQFVQGSSNAGNQWKGQVNVAFSQDIIADNEYRATFYIRSKAGSGSGRCSTTGKSHYQGDFNVSEEYTKITWIWVAEGGETGLCFDLGAVANTYYIDNVKVENLTDPYNGATYNYIPNGTLDAGSTGWSIFNGDKSQNLYCGDLQFVRSGDGCMKFIQPTTNQGGQWKGQINTGFVESLTADEVYKLKFYIRCESGVGSGRCSTTGNAQYQGDFDVTDEYRKIEWEITSNGEETGLCFDLGAVANTYYIDDIELVPARFTASKVASAGISRNSASDIDNSAIRNAMIEYINAAVGRYKGNIYAWDVVNEPMADGLSGLRSGSNTEGGKIFMWADYLGREYAADAFQAAYNADPDAVLFINDYNLESNSAKLDSLINYVYETNKILEARGSNARIHGIGTQMHISYDSYTGICSMFEKLATTGLQVRISELDVKVNSKKAINYVLKNEDEEFQAKMYNWVVEKYRNIIPKSQQYGITIWGVDDSGTWLDDYDKKLFYCPLLWNGQLEKKQAYHGVIEALK